MHGQRGESNPHIADLPSYIHGSHAYNVRDKHVLLHPSPYFPLLPAYHPPDTIGLDTPNRVQVAFRLAVLPEDAGANVPAQSDYACGPRRADVGGGVEAAEGDGGVEGDTVYDYV